MIYSVWNQGAWKYDYYRSPSVQDTANAPSPAHLAAVAQRSPLGTSADASGWPLPGDAVKIGSGEHARGRIASRRRGALTLGLGSFSPAQDIPPPVLIGIAISLGAFYLLTKKPKRRS